MLHMGLFDSRQQFRIELVVQSLRGIRPQISAFGFEPFLKGWTRPQRTRRQSPANQVRWKIMIEDEANGFIWRTPRGCEVLIGNEVTQMLQQITKVFGRMTAMRPGLQLRKGGRTVRRKDTSFSSNRGPGSIASLGTRNG